VLEDLSFYCIIPRGLLFVFFGVFMKTRVISLQFALFLRNTVNRPDLEFASLNQDMVNIFDAMPHMMPIPDGMPTDVPVVSLRSQDGAYKCEISKSRIDFFVYRLNDDKPNADVLKDFNVKVLNLCKSIAKNRDLVRFGIVVNFFHKDNTFIRTLNNKFFSKDLSGMSELGLRYNKSSKYLGFDINDVCDISSAEIIHRNEMEKGISITRDINNLPKDGKFLRYDELVDISKKYSQQLTERAIEDLLR